MLCKLSPYGCLHIVCFDSSTQFAKQLCYNFVKVEATSGTLSEHGAADANGGRKNGSPPVTPCSFRVSLVVLNIGSQLMIISEIAQIYDITIVSRLL
jgi:hypothetical protein